MNTTPEDTSPETNCIDTLATKERERLRTAQEKRNSAASAQRFTVRDEKTQDVLSFEQGEVLPMKGGWFRVVEAKGREITLELIGFTGKTKKAAKKQARAFKRYQNATSESQRVAAINDYAEAVGGNANLGKVAEELAIADRRAAAEKSSQELKSGKSEHVAVNDALDDIQRANMEKNFDDIIERDPILAESIKERIDAALDDPTHKELDRIALPPNSKTFTRGAFISDAPPAEPPNTFSAWDSAHQCWFETDEHLRGRIRDDESDSVFDGDDAYLNNPDDADYHEISEEQAVAILEEVEKDVS